MTELNYMQAVSQVKGPTHKPKLLEKTIPQIQAENTEKYPNQEFLVSLKSDRRLTFKEFDELTDKVGKGFISLGIEKGDRVGIAMRNSVEWLAAFFALFKIGAYPVNVVPSLKPKNLEYMIKQPQLKCMIANQKNIEKVVEELDPTSIQHLIGVKLEESPTGTITWNKVLKLGEKHQESERLNLVLTERRALTKPNDIAGLCYTSGTTGKPKGAMLTHSALVNNCNILSYLFNYNDSDIMPLTVPMFHFFGWVLSLLCMQQGMKLVLPTSYVRSESILQCLQDETCTTMGSAPQIYNFLVNLPNLDDYDLSYFNHCFCGSDLLSMELIEAIYDRLGVEILQNVWGSTELGGGFTVTPPESSRKKTSTIGTVIPHSELKVVDPQTGETLPLGKEGEIWGRGPTTFQGYWKKPEETEQTITKQEWVRTGDVGFIDQKGFVHFKGRVDDIFKKGARKVVPAPIEFALKQHPETLDAGVVGVPDEKYGLEVAAFVKLKGETLKQIEKSREKTKQLKQDLWKLARKNLEPFKVPKYIKFVKKLPRTATGKIRHFILKERGKKLVQT